MKKQNGCFNKISMRKRKLNLQLIETKYHGYENSPEDYILQIMRSGKNWGEWNESDLSGFFHELNHSYNDEEDGVPYHNLTHGFDAAVVLDQFLIQFGMLDRVGKSQFDRVCMLIAAYAHDNGHQGYNNHFYISNHDNLALQYSYLSPLQNMHSSNLMRMLLKHKLPLSMAHKRMMVSMIMGTDNTYHFQKMDKLALNLQQLKQKIHDEQQKQFLIDILMHAADVNNATKPTPLHLAWTQKLGQEFTRQRQKQKQKGIFTSTKLKKPGEGELHFVSAIVTPLYQHLTTINPTFQPYLQYIQQNMQYWKQLTQQDAIEEN